MLFKLSVYLSAIFFSFVIENDGSIGEELFLPVTQQIRLNIVFNNGGFSRYALTDEWMNIQYKGITYEDVSWNIETHYLENVLEENYSYNQEIRIHCIQ